MPLTKIISATRTENQSPSPETQQEVIEIFLFKTMNELFSRLTFFSLLYLIFFAPSCDQTLENFMRHSHHGTHSSCYHTQV